MDFIIAKLKGSSLEWFNIIEGGNEKVKFDKEIKVSIEKDK